MRFPRLSAALLAATVFATSLLTAQPIRIAGSDLLDGALRTSIADFGKSADLPVTFDLRGSRLGREALEAGKADLALLVFGPQDTKPSDQFSTAVIGYFTAVVVVPSDVSLTQISFPQLAGVFGASEVNNYKRWSELGALGAWAPRSISGMVLRRTTGLSLDLFLHNVLQKPQLKPTIAVLESPQDAYTRLLGEEGGIAVLASPPPENLKLKVLSLAKTNRVGDVAYPPTPENLHTGDYPLRLPVHVVFRKGEAGRLGRVIRHILADETLPALQAAGVVPLPVQARNQLVFDLETK